MCTSAPRSEGSAMASGRGERDSQERGRRAATMGDRGAGRCTRGAERGLYIGTASGSGRAAERAGPGRALWKPLECGRDVEIEGATERAGGHVSQACSSFLVPAGGEPGPVRMSVLQIPILYYFVF